MSLRAFLAWVNKSPYAPWFAMIVSGVFAYARLDATAQAQVEKINELKIEVKEKDQEYHEEMSKILLRMEGQLDRVKDDLHELSTDMTIICVKVKGGRCRTE